MLAFESPFVLCDHLNRYVSCGIYIRTSMVSQDGTVMYILWVNDQLSLVVPIHSKVLPGLFALVCPLSKLPRKIKFCNAS